VLGGVWMIGAVATYRIYRRRRGDFIRIAGTARSLEEPEMLALAETWSNRLGIRREVRLVSSTESVAPFTFGIFRPVVFIPRAVIDDPKCLEPVLAHEMAHVARFDALWLGLQHILQAVYFFHPLVWISGARLNQERERLCDATVVSAGRLTAHDYVGGLLNVLRLDLQGVEAPTMTGRKRRIGVRIKNIIDRDGGSRPRLGAAFAGAIALGVFLLPLANGGADALPAPDTPPQRGASEARVVEADLHIVNPLPGGRVTRSWGPGYLDPFTKKEVFHRGIDVGAAAGTEVLAAASGVVAVATEAYEEVPGAGTVIVIDHGNGYRTYYGHLGSLGVSPGQRVEAGEVIATVGSTGKSTGPHLHFEVQKSDTTQDPAIFVAEWR
jgi:murein DD-endopeptidase MepM/ murein hydrolase activator NlpD